MAARITHHLIELTYEAALRSYWRKEALRKFLCASHLTEAFLATWAPEESKRNFLDRVFHQLQRSDRGKAVIFEMARSSPRQHILYLRAHGSRPYPAAPTTSICGIARW